MFGSGAIGNLSISVEEANTVFISAKNRMIALNDYGRLFALLHEIGSWLVFATTAGITLISGFYGQSPSTNKAKKKSVSTLPNNAIRAISFLAAFAAVMTAFNNISTSKYEQYYAKSDNIYELIKSSRRGILETNSDAVASEIIDKLRLEIGR